MRILIGSLAFLAAGTFAEGGFHKKTLKVDGIPFSYQVYVPDGWSANRHWPVVLFLHGAGERGSDGLEQTEVGLGPVIRRRGDFPAVVVMPQCSRGRLWNDSTMEQLVMAALDRTIEEYNGDPTRVSLTGLSMGGYGVFYFASRYPKRFAALAPVCGGIVPPARAVSRGDADAADPDSVARRIGAIPIWIFHGAADNRVPVTESQRAVAALEPYNRSVRYTEYPGVGHNSWDRAYAEEGFLEWLIAQRKR